MYVGMYMYIHVQRDLIVAQTKNERIWNNDEKNLKNQIDYLSIVLQFIFSILVKKYMYMYKCVLLNDNKFIKQGLRFLLGFKLTYECIIQYKFLHNVQIFTCIYSACIRHKSITERVLKRRNSEHALQLAMNVARSRQERLVKLINEHQKLVKEVEKWSSAANMTSVPNSGSMDSSQVLDQSAEKDQSLPHLNISLNENEPIQE